MTSLYPVRHGVCNKIIKAGTSYKQEVLNKKIITLADILKKHGYTTFGAVANIHMRDELGFSQGFDFYYCEDFDEAAKINNVVFSWMDEIKQSDKYFLWIHYFDPHDPYSARAPWIHNYAADLQIGVAGLSKMTMDKLRKKISDFKQNKDVQKYLVALYDSEISYTDYHLGIIMKKLGLNNNSMIIISSDHGEEFF